MNTSMSTYCGMHLLRHKAKHFHLDSWRVELRQLHQTLRARWLRELVTAVAIKMAMMAMMGEMAMKAAQ